MTKLTVNLITGSRYPTPWYRRPCPTIVKETPQMLSARIPSKPVEWPFEVLCWLSLLILLISAITLNTFTTAILLLLYQDKIWLALVALVSCMAVLSIAALVVATYGNAITTRLPK